MTIIEPLSIKNTKQQFTVSLRGSLAHKYYELSQEGEEKLARELMQEILHSKDLDISRCLSDGVMIVGLYSEKGCFFPDW